MVWYIPFWSGVTLHDVIICLCGFEKLITKNRNGSEKQKMVIG